MYLRWKFGNKAGWTTMMINFAMRPRWLVRSKMIWRLRRWSGVRTGIPADWRTWPITTGRRFVRIAAAAQLYFSMMRWIVNVLKWNWRWTAAVIKGIVVMWKVAGRCQRFIVEDFVLMYGSIGGPNGGQCNDEHYRTTALYLKLKKIIAIIFLL